MEHNHHVRGYIAQTISGNQHFHSLDQAKKHCDSNAPGSVWHSIDVPEMNPKGNGITVFTGSNCLHFA